VIQVREYSVGAYGGEIMHNAKDAFLKSFFDVLGIAPLLTKVGQKRYIQIARSTQVVLKTVDGEIFFATDINKKAVVPIGHRGGRLNLIPVLKCDNAFDFSPLNALENARKGLSANRRTELSNARGT
jgi:hypothetical protein